MVEFSSTPMIPTAWQLDILDILHHEGRDYSVVTFINGPPRRLARLYPTETDQRSE